MWMLVLAMTKACNLLSQLGVEQFPIFSAERRALGASLGDAFDRDSIGWSMLSGLLFSGLLSLAAPWLVGLFATGFSRNEQIDALQIFYPLLLQVCIAPAMFVLRQQMLLADRKLLATILGWSLGAVQLVVLLFCFVCAIGDVNFVAIGTGVLSLVFAGVAVWLWSGSQVYRRLPDFKTLLPFVRASVTMRCTHSVHNFFVVLLTNNALSSGAEGALSIFQYVKRLADGLASVTFVPHAGVYHARQAAVWAEGGSTAFVSNVEHYFKTSLVALLLMLATTLSVGGAVLWSGDGFKILTLENAGLFCLMLLWQAVIAVETIPVGVITMAKQSLQILCVNMIYVAMLFMLTHILPSASMTGFQIGGALLVSQLLSLCLFTLLAVRIFRLKYR
ncbi:MAG: hypothetical protein ACR2IJ_02250 [Fluviibacter sp.]